MKPASMNNAEMAVHTFLFDSIINTLYANSEIGNLENTVENLIYVNQKNAKQTKITNFIIMTLLVLYVFCPFVAINYFYCNHCFVYFFSQTNFTHIPYLFLTLSTLYFPSDTELLDESYSLYGVKLPPGGPRAAPRAPFPPPAAIPPYDATRLRVENMERQLANLTGLVQKALTQTPTSHLQIPGRDGYRTGKVTMMLSLKKVCAL